MADNRSSGQQFRPAQSNIGNSLNPALYYTSNQNGNNKNSVTAQNTQNKLQIPGITQVGQSNLNAQNTPNKLQIPGITQVGQSNLTAQNTQAKLQVPGTSQFGQSNFGKQSLATIEKREPIQIVNTVISGNDAGSVTKQFSASNYGVKTGTTKIDPMAKKADPVSISSSTTQGLFFDNSKHIGGGGHISTYVPSTNPYGMGTGTGTGSNMFSSSIHQPGKMAQSTFQPITSSNQQNYNQFGLISPHTKMFNHEAYQAMHDVPKEPEEYLGDLERKLGDHRVESANLRKNQVDLEGRHTDLGTQYNMLSTEFSNLRREYDALMQVKSEQHATQAQLERTTEEKDFHYEQHVMLRRDLLNQLNKDFENDQLRREKLYAEDELRSFKEKTLVLEKQIEEQLVFANKPKSDEEGGREFYFAKKIVNLEDQIKDLMSERDQLAYENKNQKEGIREIGADVQNQTKLNDTYEERFTAQKGGLNNTMLEGGTDGMLEQLRKMKRKNEMLKKENVLIRKELESSLNTRKTPGHNVEGINTDMMRYELEDLRQENKDLKERVRNMQQELNNNKGRPSYGNDQQDHLRESRRKNLFTSSDDAERQTLQLEEYRAMIIKLKEENGLLRIQGYGSEGNNVDDRLQEVLRDYLEQIENLRSEVEQHRSKDQNKGGDDDRLKNEIRSLREERDLLKQKVRDLQRQLEIKDTDLRDLRYVFIFGNKKQDAWD